MKNSITTEKSTKMDDYLTVDAQKIEKMMGIKLRYLKGEISLEEAKIQMHASFDHVTAQEFALGEQKLIEHGITDDELAERMEEILQIFDGLLISEKQRLKEGHPIDTYLKEVAAIREVLSNMKRLLAGKFIKNQWLEQYEKLGEIAIHFSRKQNQLFPALEGKGFDKPSKVMWTLENKIREQIKSAKEYLITDQDEAFIALQVEVIHLVEDMMVKEVEILYPTALELLSDEDFIKMRLGDDEIGYCLIDTPMTYGKIQKEENTTDFMKDLALLLKKHGALGDINDAKQDVLDVKQGKLTLEQINLIFKHLQVDLSYVDENEIVKFYSDTKHRVFPRSPGVIGRMVQNCHPRESVHLVEEVIRAFRAGEQDEAEFWLEMGDKFIYIIYNAVRDEDGTFRGVLEMMQDVTHIRSLKGSQRLLSWEKSVETTSEPRVEESTIAAATNPYGITKDTIVGNLVKEFPFIKAFLISLSPNYKKLGNPILFKTMSSIATIEMIAERGNLQVDEMIGKLVKEIQSNNG